MNTSETVRKEILRLVKARHNSAYINTRRLSAFFNYPETSVKRVLVKLADEKLVRLSGWDGHELRPYPAWRSADDFVNSTADGGNVHVDLVLPV